MIIDRLTLVSNAQAVTASAVSTDTVDLSQARDIGPGEEVQFSVTVDVAATAAGAATVQFQIISSASAALTTPTVLFTTDAIAIAQLTLGRRPIELTVPRSILAAQPVGQRFLGTQYVVATGPLTAGSFTTAQVVNFQDVGKNYASGFALT